MLYDLAGVMQTYRASDAGRTIELYVRLSTIGPLGVIAANLFRAQKASERAKTYRGPSKGEAYRKKEWSLGNVCKSLQGNDVLPWGWGLDRGQPVHRHVLYVDLPTGQVSFHSEFRGEGPDYPGEWDGKKGQGPDRITRWAVQLLAEAAADA